MKNNKNTALWSDFKARRLYFHNPRFIFFPYSVHTSCSRWESERTFCSGRFYLIQASLRVLQNILRNEIHCGFKDWNLSFCNDSMKFDVQFFFLSLSSFCRPLIEKVCHRYWNNPTYITKSFLCLAYVFRLCVCLIRTYLTFRCILLWNFST